ncbi:MAG: hypothetical protein U0176_17810 [Bacteroidia bacterium]
MDKFNLNRGQYFHWMERIGDILIAHLSTGAGLVKTSQQFTVASALVRADKLDAAEDLIKVGIRTSMELEDFELAMRFWNLAAPPPATEAPRLPTATTILQLRNNLQSYEILWDQFQQAKALPGREERLAAIHSILLAPAMVVPSAALSNRAMYIFRRLRLNCYAHLREYDLALEEVRQLLDHTRAFPWIHEDPEFHEAKAMATQARLLLLTNRKDQQGIAAAEFEGRQFSSIAARKEQSFFRFPHKIKVAILSGQENHVTEAIEAFLRLSAEEGQSYSNTYITQNLCISLYGAFAAGNEALSTRLLRLLGSFRRTDFRPEYYCLYQFLFLAQALKSEDWPEARRLIKNLKSSTVLDCFQGLPDLLDCFTNLIGKWVASGTSSPLPMSHSDQSALAAACESLDFVDYFDILAWMEALREGCSLLTILRERASASEAQQP